MSSMSRGIMTHSNHAPPVSSRASRPLMGGYGGSLVLLCLSAHHVAAAGCGAEVALPVVSGPRSEGPAHGRLLLVGGGGTTPAIDAAAARLAGGAAARWVVIPTASDDTEIPGLRRENSVTSLHQPFVVLHTRDKAEADTEAFVSPLRTATAVWFEGGRQTRLVDAYAGTRTEQALRDLLARGGLIAGTSAGATIQGSRLVRGGGRGSIMTAPGYTAAFGYIRNVAVDQHIDARGRESDLAALIAVSPGVLGIGLDERTGLVVQGNIARVLGAGRVLLTDGADHLGSPFWCLRAGQAFDLTTWRRIAAPRASSGDRWRSAGRGGDDLVQERLHRLHPVLGDGHAVAGEHIGRDMPPGAAGDEDRAAVVLPEQGAHRQIQRERRMRRHGRRAIARIAKQNDRARRKPHADSSRGGGMVDFAEHDPARPRHRIAETRDGLWQGARAALCDQPGVRRDGRGASREPKQAEARE